MSLHPCLKSQLPLTCPCYSLSGTHQTGFSRKQQEEYSLIVANLSLFCQTGVKP
jgi:hypothetical protein